MYPLNTLDQLFHPSDHPPKQPMGMQRSLFKCILPQAVHVHQLTSYKKRITHDLLVE